MYRLCNYLFSLCLTCCKLSTLGFTVNVLVRLILDHVWKLMVVWLLATQFERRSQIDCGWLGYLRGWSKSSCTSCHWSWISLNWLDALLNSVKFHSFFKFLFFADNGLFIFELFVVLITCIFIILNNDYWVLVKFIFKDYIFLLLLQPIYLWIYSWKWSILVWSKIRHRVCRVDLIKIVLSVFLD